MLKQYQCHKRVSAFKIHQIVDPTPHNQESDGSRLLLSDSDEFVKVNHEYMRKHKPEVGGYYVQYDDGYSSFSPAEPFEKGYTLVPMGQNIR